MHARNILINTPLFSSLGNEELCAFEQYFKEKRIDKNTVVFQEQEEADAFFLLIEGKVKVMLTDREGREVIVAILGSGEYFGEMALLDTAGRSAQVMAMQPCRVLALAKDDFYRCLNGHPEIAMKIIQQLSQRLRRANDTINSLATLDVQARVARVLLEAAEYQNGQLIVEASLTQKDIANMVGASRERVNRTLKSLEEKGFLRTNGRRIIITEVRRDIT